ncbi:MAG TPA: mobile mystery protein A, partial [Nocardioides bacterium]|nr:mobile mystery protein A [Nocardioides sp.]
GWIRAIREALGMRAEDLARRMDVSQSSLTRLERSEKSGRVRFDTLKRAADALECEVVYALVPRRPLEEMVQEQARKRALARVGRTAHTMALEDQALVDAKLEERVQFLARYLATRPGLWVEDSEGDDPSATLSGAD